MLLLGFRGTGLFYGNIIHFTFFSQASLGVISTLASSRFVWDDQSGMLQLTYDLGEARVTCYIWREGCLPTIRVCSRSFFFVAYQKYSSDSLHLRVPSNSLTILGTDVGMGIYILHASRFVGFYCLKLRNKVDMWYGHCTSDSCDSFGYHDGAQHFRSFVLSVWL